MTFIGPRLCVPSYTILQFDFQVLEQSVILRIPACLSSQCSPALRRRANEPILRQARNGRSAALRRWLEFAERISMFRSGEY